MSILLKSILFLSFWCAQGKKFQIYASFRSFMKANFYFNLFRRTFLWDYFFCAKVQIGTQVQHFSKNFISARFLAMWNWNRNFCINSLRLSSNNGIQELHILIPKVFKVDKVFFHWIYRSVHYFYHCVTRVE